MVEKYCIYSYYYYDCLYSLTFPFTLTSLFSYKKKQTNFCFIAEIMSNYYSSFERSFKLKTRHGKVMIVKIAWRLNYDVHSKKTGGTCIVTGFSPNI